MDAVTVTAAVADAVHSANVPTLFDTNKRGKYLVDLSV